MYVLKGLVTSVLKWSEKKVNQKDQERESRWFESQQVDIVCCGAVAQLVERPSKFPEQLYLCEFESRLRQKYQQHHQLWN